MTRDQYDALQNAVPVVPMVSAAKLTDQSDRTLLWGYDCDRHSWHVFLRGGIIERYVYGRGWFTDSSSSDHKRDEFWPAEQLVPNKRLYPEACDAEFCALLINAGAFLPFTTFNDERETKQFYGDVPENEVAA